VTESDYSGINIADSGSHQIVYKLVALPTTDTINQALSVFSYNSLPKPEYDKNFLFCQSLFYTWLKNKPTDYNPYVPRQVCTPAPSSGRTSSRTPSRTPSSTPSQICTIPGPPQPLSCPGPVFASDIQPQNKTSVPPGFFSSGPSADVDLSTLGGYEAPPKPNNTMRNIIIGVVVAIILIGGGLYWYLYYGPGKIEKIPSIVVKTKGGYYYI
jgi:hypothetical protein